MLLTASQIIDEYTGPESLPVSNRGCLQAAVSANHLASVFRVVNRANGKHFFLNKLVIISIIFVFNHS